MNNSQESPPATTAPPRASLGERLIPFLILGVVLAIDQSSKYLVENRLALYETFAPFPAIEALFRLTHTTNTGAAFGIFQNGSLILAVLAVIISGVIIYFNQTLPGGQPLLRVALGLQLGGAMGNLVDRVRQGHVTDFLDFGPIPIFNFADVSIVLGVLLLGWLMLRESRAQASNPETDPVSSFVAGSPVETNNPRSTTYDGERQAN